MAEHEEGRPTGGSETANKSFDGDNPSIPDLLAEKHVLAAMLEGVEANVTIDDFDNLAHRTIYTAIRELIDADQTVESGLILQKVVHDPSARAAMTNLVEVITRDVEPYVDIVKAAAARRQIRSVLAGITQQIDMRDPHDLAAHAAEVLSGIGDSTSRHKGIANIAMTRSQLADLPEAEPLIDGVLNRNSMMYLYGRKSTWKSFIAIDWALSLATGTPWQGRTVKQTRVLYIAAEGAYTLTKRVDSWEGHTCTAIDDDQFVVLPRPVNLFTGHEMHDLRRFIRDCDFGLVIVDTLRRSAPGADENSTKDMGLVIDNIDSIKRAAGSVLVLAHSDAGDNKLRGITAIEDDADIVWQAKRTAIDQVKLVQTKVKDAEPDQTVIITSKAQGDSIVMVPELDDSTVRRAPVNHTEAAVKILDALREAFPGGTQGGPLNAVACLPKPTFYRTLKKLREDGYVINAGTEKSKFYVLPDEESHESHPESHESHEGQSHEEESHPLVRLPVSPVSPESHHETPL